MQGADGLISFAVDGLDEAEAMFDSVLNRLDVWGKVADEAIRRVRAVTPTGYSGKLPTSVLSERTESSVTIGYSTGVDTAGTRPRKKRKKGEKKNKRKWITVPSLESKFESVMDGFSAEFSVMMASTIEGENVTT